jgi:hypothetical protein
MGSGFFMEHLPGDGSQPINALTELHRINGHGIGKDADSEHDPDPDADE